MPYKDPEKQRANDRLRMKRWRKAHPEKVKKQNAAARAKMNWNAYAKRWRDDNPEPLKAIKRRNLLKRYGLTMELFEAMLASQNGACKTCLKPFVSSKDTHVDHNHTTGKVRGLLCSRCNSAIGLLREDPFIFARVVAYLKLTGTIPADDMWHTTRFVDLSPPRKKAKHGPTPNVDVDAP